MSDSSTGKKGAEKQVTGHSQEVVDDVLRCSFCHKSQDAVAKLISSPSNYARAYICDECVAVCNSLLEDDEPHPIRLFYSYSHQDEKLRLRLDEHLAVLKRQGIIAEWHDRKIAPGIEWESKIDEELKSANIILLLVSASFVASDYCYGRELQQALKRHKDGECRVIPVILRPVEWSHTPFAFLQALPRDGKPVTMWSNRESALLDVAKGIRKTVQELRATPLTSEQNAQSHRAKGQSTNDSKERAALPEQPKENPPKS